MTEKPRHIRLESARSAMRATGANALASALITGINEAKENGQELTELQQIDMAKMHIMSYEEVLDGVDTLEVDEYFERTYEKVRNRMDEYRGRRHGTDT